MGINKDKGFKMELFDKETEKWFTMDSKQYYDLEYAKKEPKFKNWFTMNSIDFLASSGTGFAKKAIKEYRGNFHEEVEKVNSQP